METVEIRPNDSLYPAALKRHLGNSAPRSISAIGNLDILSKRKMAFFSSMKCPGSIILKASDLIRELSGEELAVMSGFHSALERECLNILLRKKQPIIIVPARSIKGIRIKAEYKKPLDEGRLLLLSPFDEKQNRISLKRSAERNRFVAAIADLIFIPHAEPASKTEQLCRGLLEWKKPLCTIDDRANANLIALGLQRASQELFGST